jgi:catechol 2,3-dioxygenase-like lactoylglutathione lyase family enzyme/ketosteroid isomerase-like protein
MKLTPQEQEILDLENAYWRSIQAGDVQAALQLTGEPCLISGSQGAMALTPRQYEEMSKDSSWKLHRYEITEPVVHLASADVAVIAYKVREEMTLEGKPHVLEAADSSTWVRHNSRWRCVQHSESILGDPFGRDRIQPQAAAKTPIAGQDAVANLAVRDLSAAQKFYEEVLGLTPVHHEGKEVVVYRSGRSTLNVYRSKFAGTNQATAVTWEVDDIESAVKNLKAKGVAFEHYEMPGTERKGDVHESQGMKVAWFKDPDGNILNLISTP